jgi:hypothetical protein
LKVIDDAEEEARRYVAEAQERADRMVAERLRQTADELEGDAADNKPEGGVADSGGRRLRAVEPEAGGPPPVLNGSSAARLLATQMAVSGSSRKEIEAKLRNAFEIEDTDEILDAILGPEG